MTDSDRLDKILIVIARVDERTHRSEADIALIRDSAVTHGRAIAALQAVCSERQRDNTRRDQRISQLCRAVDGVEDTGMIDRARLTGSWTALKTTGALVGGMVAIAAAAVALLQAWR